MTIHKQKRYIKENGLKIGLVIVLIVFAIYSRMLPHPPNFAPIAAVALFGGAMLPKKWALAIPLLAMIISDVFIGLHPLIFVTWGSFLLIALASGTFLRRISPTRILSMSIGASVFFYLVTNFAVWAQGLMYTMTPSGLLQCYINALPFFRNTLLGDAVFTMLLFGVYYSITAWIPHIYKTRSAQLANT